MQLIKQVKEWIDRKDKTIKSMFIDAGISSIKAMSFDEINWETKEYSYA